jgi:hypothetical protein
MHLPWWPLAPYAPRRAELMSPPWSPRVHSGGDVDHLPAWKRQPVSDPDLARHAGISTRSGANCLPFVGLETICPNCRRPKKQVPRRQRVGARCSATCEICSGVSNFRPAARSQRHLWRRRQGPVSRLARTQDIGTHLLIIETELLVCGAVASPGYHRSRSGADARRTLCAACIGSRGRSGCSTHANPARLSRDRRAPLSRLAGPGQSANDPRSRDRRCCCPYLCLQSSSREPCSRRADSYVSSQMGAGPVVRDESVRLLRRGSRLDVVQHLRAGVRVQHASCHRGGHDFFTAAYLSKPRAAEAPQIFAASLVGGPFVRFLPRDRRPPSPFW